MTNEILNLSSEEIKKIQKSFSTISVEGNKVTTKDWLDDSVQVTYKRPNPEALDEAVQIIKNLHKTEPSDAFIKSIEDTNE